MRLQFICLQSISIGSCKRNRQTTISASKEYATGLMYDIHLNHGCIDFVGMTSEFS